LNSVDGHAKFGAHIPRATVVGVRGFVEGLNCAAITGGKLNRRANPLDIVALQLLEATGSENNWRAVPHIIAVQVASLIAVEIVAGK
jgi:hypothetical protein